MPQSRRKLQTSRLCLLSYGLALSGAIGGICAHIALAAHDQGYHVTVLGVLWAILPFVLVGAVAYVVRHFRYSCCAVAFLALILASSCLGYVGVTDDDELPFMVLGTLPIFQLFALGAFSLPILAAT